MSGKMVLSQCFHNRVVMFFFDIVRLCFSYDYPQQKQINEIRRSLGRIGDMLYELDDMDVQKKLIIRNTTFRRWKTCLYNIIITKSSKI